jgi:hypothetical protein
VFNQWISLENKESSKGICPFTSVMPRLRMSGDILSLPLYTFVAYKWKPPPLLGTDPGSFKSTA